MEPYFDETEIRRTIATLKPNGELFEVRVIYSDGKNLSGYFRDAETLINALHRISLTGCNVYMTLHHLKEECFGREQRERFVRSTRTATSDSDVTAYEWFVMDFDPARPSGTSSTEAQLQLAKTQANKVYRYMSQIGFEKPITALSGNGCHLLYRIDLPCTADNKKIVEKTLKAMDVLFSEPDSKVDTTMFNPARICKLYGTLAQKGSNTAEQPFRMSRILTIPQEIKATSPRYLQKICATLPEQPERKAYNGYSPQTFDLEGWMTKYGIIYQRQEWSEGDKYKLDCCPFDANHKGKDAMIFRRKDGSIGFHCFHNSCVGKTWRDVRLLFEPDAYEKREQEAKERMYGQRNRDKPKEVAPMHEEKDNPIWENAIYILDKKTPEDTFVRTGVDLIDRKMRGLKKGYVSLISGLRASGKSSVLSQITLNAVDDGNNVGVFSGELTDKNFMRWMNLQAAGKAYAVPTQYDGFYTVDFKVRKKIADWLGNRFWLYNNDYGRRYAQVAKELEKAIEDKKLDLLILDNLMAFDISDLAQDSKWDAQSKFVLDLERMAKRYNVHILFVAHPRKARGFLRLDDISGSNDLVNAVDNAFIVHRVNEDYRRLTKETFGWKESHPTYEASNVIEIAKDRDGGTQDVFVPLYYEKESKRLRNSDTENVIYGWVDGADSDMAKKAGKGVPDGFVPVKDDDEVVFD